MRPPARAGPRNRRASVPRALGTCERSVGLPRQCDDVSRSAPADLPHQSGGAGPPAPGRTACGPPRPGDGMASRQRLAACHAGPAVRGPPRQCDGTTACRPEPAAPERARTGRAPAASQAVHRWLRTPCTCGHRPQADTVHRRTRGPARQAGAVSRRARRARAAVVPGGRARTGAPVDAHTAVRQPRNPRTTTPPRRTKASHRHARSNTYEPPHTRPNTHKQPHTPPNAHEAPRTQADLNGSPPRPSGPRRITTAPTRASADHHRAARTSADHRRVHPDAMDPTVPTRHAGAATPPRTRGSPRRGIGKHVVREQLGRRTGSSSPARPVPGRRHLGRPRTATPVPGEPPHLRRLGRV